LAATLPQCPRIRQGGIDGAPNPEANVPVPSEAVSVHDAKKIEIGIEQNGHYQHEKGRRQRKFLPRMNGYERE
jgi:hypothetical protein